MQTIKVASNSLVRSGSPSLVLNVWLTNCHMAWRNGEHILLAHASHNVQRNPSQMDLLHFAVGSCFVIKGTLQTSDACIKRGMHALHVIYNGFVLCFPETMLWLAQSIRSCRLSQLIHVAFTESCESGSAPEASRGRPCSLHRLQSVILMAWSSFSSLARLFWQYNCNRWHKFWQRCVRVNTSRDLVKVSLPMLQCMCQNLCVFEKSCQNLLPLSGTFTPKWSLPGWRFLQR